MKNQMMSDRAPLGAAIVSGIDSLERRIDEQRRRADRAEARVLELLYLMRDVRLDLLRAGGSLRRGSATREAIGAASIRLRDAIIGAPERIPNPDPVDVDRT